MAILESEKRPRGLRVPSLSSIKANGLSFHKKSSDAVSQSKTSGPQDKQLPQPPTTAAAPGAAVDAPMPVRLPAASASESAFSLDAVPMADMAIDRYPMPPGTAPTSPFPAPPRGGPGPNNSINNNTPNHGGRDGSLAVPPVQRTPSSGSHQSEEADPLEDYVPSPEVETASPAPEMIAPDESDEYDHDEDHANNANRPGEEAGDQGAWTPPDYEPVAAPLNKLHFACYQEHRAMRVAANKWYPLPCMTCQKFDRENRRLCVFCSLRVCEGCFEGLNKCQRRSLAELMEVVQ